MFGRKGERWWIPDIALNMRELTSYMLIPKGITSVTTCRDGSLQVAYLYSLSLNNFIRWPLLSFTEKKCRVQQAVNQYHTIFPGCYLGNAASVWFRHNRGVLYSYKAKLSTHAQAYQT